MIKITFSKVILPFFSQARTVSSAGQSHPGPHLVPGKHAAHFRMSIHIKEAGMNVASAALQQGHTSASIDVKDIDTLSSLTEFYESDQGLEEEESEVDLMIQLSGMVYNDNGSDE